MSAQFIESLEGRSLFSGSPVGGGVGPVGPGPENSNGVGIHDRDRDRVQDGTCRATAAGEACVNPDALKERIQQRLQDGSCKA